jgi:hypothetical protein
MLRLVLAAALLAHGLIHLSWLTPAPRPLPAGPGWPFDAGRSWLVSAVGLDPAVAHLLAIVLGITTVSLFGMAALATMGWLVPPAWWQALASAGAISSLGMLAAFFHPWLALGIVIDAAILWVTLAVGWAPTGSAP